MDDFYALLTAGLAGVIGGFLFCIPVGPINITIINEGARRGFFWACMIGLGAMAMDLIYCSIAFAGFSSIFASDFMKAVMQLLSFLFLIYLGMKYLLTASLPATTPTVEAVEHKLHPHTAFWIGFVRVLGNPAVLLFWITMSATFMAHDLINDTPLSKAVCVLGTFVGGTTWFLLLSFLVAKGHGKFSTKGLIRMAHISGAVLLLAGVWVGFQLVKTLAKQRRHQTSYFSAPASSTTLARHVDASRETAG